MTNKSILVIAGLAVLLALGALFKPAPVQQIIREQLGAQAGPDSTHPYESINNVYRYYYSSGLNQASTTVCSFKSPSATSTLTIGSLSIRTGTTTALFWEFGRGTVMDATTTSLGTKTTASGVQATLLASTSPALTQNDGNAIFPPNTYLNVKYGGPLGSTNVLVGSCKAEFIVN